MDLEKEIEDIKDVQREHSRILLRLESVIVDDKDTDRVGYGTRIKKIEEYVNSDKKVKWYISGFVAATAITLKELYSKIF